MSEIICPHCGTSNSIVALECSACHKSLYEEPTQPFQNPEKDEMEWLKDYRSFGEDTDFTTNEDSSGEPDLKTEPEIPDWLARIRARSREDAPVPVDDTQLEDENPDLSKAESGELAWLEGLKDMDDRRGGEIEQSEEFPDWLSRLAARKAEDAHDAVEGHPSASKEPDEETESNPVETISREPTIEAFDFLRDHIEPEELIPSEPSIPEEIIDSSPKHFEPFDNLPPYLDDESDQAAIQSEEPPAEVIEGPGYPEGLPSFLFEDVQGIDKPAEIEESEPEAEFPNLDWLYNSSSETPSSDDNLPARLSNFEGIQFENDTAESIIKNESDQTNLPEWLFDQSESFLSEEPGAKLTDSPGSDGVDFSPKPGQDKPLYDEASIPDWLKSPQPFEENSDFSETAQPEIESEAMPGWLEAMRPVDNTAVRKITAQTDDRIEASGPLAGYQGVLPGEKAAARYSKPPVYGSRMQVTDKQRIYATLFDTLIAEEKQPEARVVEKIVVPPQTIRLVVGLITIGILIIALLFNVNAAILPALFPPENVAFFSKIQALSGISSPSRILVGIDFEPGLSGELSSMSSSVIEDILSSDSTMVFVSLNPSGPALSNDLLVRAAESEARTGGTDHIINLGYLPGGASALAGLALAPKQTAPVTIDGTPTWDNPSVSGINSAADFNAILLLTDNADSARNWIEQITPAAPNTPFLILASAQAAPALQPYVHSGQVSGMLAGFSGSLAYQQLAMKSDSSIGRYWDAYQIGLLLTAVFMLLGAIIYGVLGLVAHFKKA